MYMKNTYAIELFGIIQGVGFRPFVYRLAHTMGLKGYVQNQYDRLFILLEVGTKEQLDAFVAHILSSPPPNARIVKHIITPISQKQSLSDVFEIRESHANKTFVPILLPQDMRICESCLADIRTQGRFYRYAFTTCTDCGARYSIINALPYDRIHTTMRDFALCAKCEADYRNSLNRRFHAQPISCNTCAIQLMLFDSQGTQISADSINDYEMIRAVASAIKAGKIVAIKGVGGFNLIADANNKEAIATLRKRKNRPHKPFAVMFKSISDIESLSDISAQERESLLSPQAPIVLLERHCRAGGVIDERALDIIAPHLKTLGAILPYNGIMHLLFDELESPIIFTSANLSGEPIIAKTRELIEKLCKRNAIADLVLSYNRAIHNPSDDSIVRLMAGEMRILRLARGYAPLDLLYTHSGAQDLESHEAGDSTKYMDSNITESHTLVVGVGAQQKSSICFLNRHRANISPYIGDLESVDSIMRYESVSAFFNTLYKQTPQIVVCDLHPRYVSTQKAQSLKASCYALAHHKAHFYAILGEARALDKNALGIIWDGTGLGEDRRIWGGECFLYEADSYAGSMRRLWHFDEYALLGGEGAIKDIGKIALSLLIHYDLFTSPQAQDILHRHFSSEELGLLQGAYRSRTYPLTSSVGRIFDAVGFLLGLLQIQTYEGQSGALIESCALEYVRDKTMPKPYAFSLENGCVCLKGIIESILTDKEAREKKACRFLETLAHIALTLAKEGIEEAQASLQVYFSGGVFQNKFLCDRIHTLFNVHKIPFFMHTQLPCNDSNISFGQAVFGTLESKRSKNAGK